MEQWLYGEGADTTRDVYEQKLKDLQVLGEPIKNRFRAFEAVREATHIFGQELGNL